jgi:hypothetical protein
MESYRTPAGHAWILNPDYVNLGIRSTWPRKWNGIILAFIGLGPGFGVTRGDVEEWLAERTREAAKLQLDTLWWAKAAAWISGIVGGICILVAIALASLPHH